MHGFLSQNVVEASNGSEDQEIDMVQFSGLCCGGKDIHCLSLKTKCRTSGFSVRHFYKFLLSYFLIWELLLISLLQHNGPFLIRVTTDGYDDTSHYYCISVDKYV